MSLSERSYAPTNLMPRLARSWGPNGRPDEAGKAVLTCASPGRTQRLAPAGKRGGISPLAPHAYAEDGSFMVVCPACDTRDRLSTGGE